MSRPKAQEQTKQKHHEDIEAAGAVAIPIPPPSRGSLVHHHGDDPFHRRNNKLDASSSATGVEKSTSNILETDLNSSLTEIPRGHSFLPVASGGDNTTRSRQSSASSPHSSTKTKPPEPKLIHPLLTKIPLHIRFGLNGLLTNILFMVIYNWSVFLFEHQIKVTTIYAITYFVFIPLGHLSVSLLVFGWPEKYIASLMSNFPIGLTALAIGGVLTGYLDEIQFSDMIDDFIRDHFTFHQMPPRGLPSDHENKNEFWSSLLVLVVTSLWTYVLSIYVNSSPTKSEKKEL